MRRLSVIIPSRTATNFLACGEAVHQNDPEVRIVLVDDGVGIDDLPCAVVPGEKPFIFARNVNLGIQFAGDDDVVILNDDALLKTPGGFTFLQMVAQDHPDFGLIAASTNNVGNRNQQPQNRGLREDPRMVCFVCVLIPRRTIELVGLLDERFIHYGMDDDDYSLRVRNAGLKIGIDDDCFVDHSSLKSSYRGEAGAGGDYKPNLEIFIEKWGVDNFGRIPCA